MDLTEDELLTAIRRVLSGAGPEVRIGPGDDAAVLAPLSGEIVVTTDVLVEGVHFDRMLTSARDLGYKAIVVNVSDVAAMAASPRAAVCALTLGGDVDAAWTMELFGGMREAAGEHALWLVGGDLSGGSCGWIAVTVIGEVAAGRAVPRSGARVGDLVVVTGSLGAAAAGLRVTRDGRPASDLDRRLLRAHFRPVARVGEAQVLERHGATAMMDVSDGLTLDLSRLCAASGAGVRLALGEVPVAEGATLDEALGGGDDYELLATLPSADAVETARDELRETFGVPLAEIGVIVEEGLTVSAPDGGERPLRAMGWDHFRA
ncbi:MAG: thiamine-phosphate kinase [Actinobacteria bacterium]|nr:thiamine-phosphate kinase [Actinomycetota bacterium]